MAALRAMVGPRGYRDTQDARTLGGLYERPRAAPRERNLRRASQLVEPPTAAPHGGWCGGWGLDTPGYPIRRLFSGARHSRGVRLPTGLGSCLPPELRPTLHHELPVAREVEVCRTLASQA